MIPAVLIAKKRDGQRLTDAEIAWFINGFTHGQIADYQMSAMAMAICLRGMDAGEVSALTEAMLRSGDVLPRSSSGLPRVDKHSTGGLGDKVSLILAPLLACCGVEVPMISGRGLGLTGGTLDKLEAIPGFQCDLSTDASSAIVSQIACHIISASERLAPADRRLYRLRDVTGTVESVALITASILSKKLAASLDALVMDVKVGGGAFMKTLDDARGLALSLVETGRQMHLPVTALLTDMDQPLGQAIGNAIEVNEVIELMRGDGPSDVRELTLQLCSELLVAVKVCPDHDAAILLLKRKWDDGSAMQRFEQMIALQGGRIKGPLPLAAAHRITSEQSGIVHAIDCSTIGQCIVAMGGGRRQADDKIDPMVGVRVNVSIGDRVTRGQELAVLHAHQAHASPWTTILRQAVVIMDDPVASRKLVIERIGV